MLLALLNHHEGLFNTIIAPLSDNRDFKSLRALMGTCRKLYGVVFAHPAWIHRIKYKTTTTNIQFNRIMYSNEYGSITFIERGCASKRLVCYQQYCHRDTIDEYVSRLLLIHTTKYNQHCNNDDDITLFTMNSLIIYPDFIPTWLLAYSTSFRIDANIGKMYTCDSSDRNQWFQIVGQ